jgi:hypothetical protein
LPFKKGEELSYFVLNEHYGNSAGFFLYTSYDTQLCGNGGRLLTIAIILKERDAGGIILPEIAPFAQANKTPPSLVFTLLPSMIRALSVTTFTRQHLVVRRCRLLS